MPCVTVKLLVFMVDGSIASLKEAVIVSLSGTFVSELAGPVVPMAGAVVSGARPVVKLQLSSVLSGFPARSLASVLIVTV
jgi:hypothetical protein